MPSNPQDTVGTMHPSITLAHGNGVDAATISHNGKSLSVSGYNYTPSAQLTTTNAIPSTNYVQVMGNHSIPATNWSYSWYPYYPDQSPRIAALEGEVRVLREMLAALLSGVKTGGAKPRAKRRSAK